MRFMFPLLAAALTATSMAQAQTKWDLPAAYPATNFHTENLVQFAADVEKASGGSIKVAVFPSEQLGKAFDHYDMARDGIADVTYISPGYQPGRFPIIDAGNLPFMLADAKGGSQALDAWYRKYAGQEMKDVKFLVFQDRPGVGGKQAERVPGVSPSMKDGVWAERSLATGSPFWRSTRSDSAAVPRNHGGTPSSGVGAW